MHRLQPQHTDLGGQSPWKVRLPGMWGVNAFGKVVGLGLQVLATLSSLCKVN